MKNNENDFQFKDFLYLNYSFLESFTAQKHRGFPREKQGTSVKQVSKERIGNKIDNEETLGGKVGITSLGVTGSTTTTTSGKQLNQSNTETSQNTLIKVEKENMYDDFMEYVKKNHLFMDVSNPEVGKYIDLYEKFYYLDFDRIEKLCNEDYLTIYQSTINSDEFTDEKFKGIRNNVALLKTFFPCNAMLYKRDYIVLIDKSWIKIGPEYLGYLLGEKIHVAGKVSKLIYVDNDMPYLIKVLNMIQKSVLSILHELGFDVSDKVFMILPIAIYH